MKKIFLILVSLLFLNGCSQYSAMVGPSITLVESGSLLQATTSYGSSYGMNIARQNISEELKTDRICQTVHSSDLSKIFFETFDENCVSDPMSIYR